MRIARSTSLFSLGARIGRTKSWPWFGLAGLAGLTHGNGLDLLLNVDADGNLTGMRTSDGSTVVQDLTLAYDAASAITAITDNLDSSRSQSFDYDGVGRLVWADGAYGEIDYGYDLVGNRTRRTVDGGATADDFYAYETGSHRLASVTSGPSVREVDYTAAGSTSLDTRGGVEVEFGYGASGRLMQVTSDSGPLASRTYGYDAAGKRVRETRANRLAGGGGVLSTSHGYVYDLDGHLLAQYDYAVSGQVASVRREYVWLGDTPVGMVDHAMPGNPVLAIHTDHLGRPQKLTDASQVVVWDGQFDPFGEEHAVTGTTDQPLRFPGQEWDAATGLSQNWNRDYDPTLGRYIESDPIGLGGGVSTYGYVGGDPLKWIDPTGESPILWAIIGGVLGTWSAPSAANAPASMESELTPRQSTFDATTAIVMNSSGTGRSVGGGIATGVGWLNTQELAVRPSRPHARKECKPVETVGVPWSPYPDAEPPSDPGASVRLCMARCFAKFRMFRSKLALCVAVCVLTAF